MTSDDVMSRAMGPVNQMGMEQWLSAFTGGAGNSTSSSGSFNRKVIVSVDINVVLLHNYS